MAALREIHCRLRRVVVKQSVVEVAWDVLYSLAANEEHETNLSADRTLRCPVRVVRSRSGWFRRLESLCETNFRPFQADDCCRSGAQWLGGNLPLGPLGEADAANLWVRRRGFCRQGRSSAFIGARNQTGYDLVEEIPLNCLTRT